MTKLKGQIFFFLFITIVTHSTFAQQWKIITTGNSPMPSNNIGYFGDRLTVDSDNRVWIAFGTEGAAVYSEQKNQWVVYNSSNSPLANNATQGVHGVLADSTSVWAVQLGGGIFKFDGTTWQTISASKSGVYLGKDPDHNIWINNILTVQKYNGSTITDVWNQLPDEDGFIYEIDTDHDGKVWVAQYDDIDLTSTIGQLNGTVSYDKTDAAILSSPVWRVEFTSNNNVWIGTFDYEGTSINVPAKGMAYLNRATNLWTEYNVTNSPLPHNYVRALKTDSQDRLWVGTSGGLVRFDGTEWRVYNKSNSPLPSDTINAIVIDTLGTKWIGTPKGLVRFNEIIPALQVTGCGLSLSFSDHSQSFDGPMTAWKWNFGGLGTSSEQNPQFTFPQAGKYMVTLTVTDQMGTSNFITQEITVTDFSMDFIMTAGNAIINNGTVYTGTPVTFTTTVPGNSPSWDLGNGVTASTESVTTSYSRPGTYTVYLTPGLNDPNCPANIARSIEVVDIFIANAVTPDSDGKNDALIIEPMLDEASIRVVNRWGKPVYERDPYSGGFDGKSLESGVYYYELRFLNFGNVYKGFVHIIKQD